MTTMAFHLFHSLPTELRQHIWQLTVYDDSPEVCLCWPSNLHLGYTHQNPLDLHPTLPFTVDLPFPIGMHVCRESRAAVQPLICWRSSTAAGCAVPFRVFRPDMDTLYLGSSSVPTVECMMPEYAQDMEDATPEERQVVDAVVAILRETKHIAFEWICFYMDDMSISDWVWLGGWDSDIPYEDRASWPDGKTMAALPRRLSYVVPSSRYLGSAEGYREFFQHPGRRCKLVPLSDEALHQVKVREERSSQPLVSAAEAVELTRPWLAEAQRLGRHDFYAGAGEHLVKSGEGLNITACTFVEYQKDGTWKEVCHYRVWSPAVEGKYWGHWASAKPVPMQERPDPEVVRVLDSDVEFAPWASPRYRGGMFQEMQVPMD